MRWTKLSTAVLGCCVAACTATALCIPGIASGLNRPVGEYQESGTGSQEEVADVSSSFEGFVDGEAASKEEEAAPEAPVQDPSIGSSGADGEGGSNAGASAEDTALI